MNVNERIAYLMGSPISIDFALFTTPIAERAKRPKAAIVTSPIMKLNAKSFTDINMGTRVESANLCSKMCVVF